MDTLQHMMESNSHLTAAHTVINHIAILSNRWHFLSEEDRDYVQAAQLAIEEQLEWNVNN
jgi:hypothetical protein